MEKPILVEFKPAKQIPWSKILWWCAITDCVSMFLIYQALT